MKAVRRLSIAALVVACLHLIFGAIVRISGSGMGCGDNWPKCYGYWFPPFSRPDLVVEVSHRYLASILTLTVLSMAFVAFRNRRVEGVSGRGGPLRSAFGAVGAVFTAAILGGVTVKMGNAPWATVAHWLVAMTLLAMVATTAIRAGALGGASALVQSGTARAKRSAFAAAVLAIFAVALGGLTAKYPGASVGCTTVPMCGANPSVEPAGVHIQLTHRTIAVLLVLHLFGVVAMVRKRRATEAPVVFKAAHIALGMVLLQLVVASAMILFHLPPVLRSLHEATGVGIWLSCFALAYLARLTANNPGGREESLAPAPSSAPAAAASFGAAAISRPEQSTGLGFIAESRRSEQNEEPTLVARELSADTEPVAAPDSVEAAPVVAAPQLVTEDSAPIVEDSAPIVEASARVVEASAPTVEIAAPIVEIAAVDVEEATPVEEVPAVVLEVSAPVVEEAAPVVEQAAVVEDEAAPEIFETADLDYTPRAAAVEELDEFSLPPEPKPGFPEIAPEPVVEKLEKKEVMEEVVAESSMVTPPVEEPKISPLPPKPPAHTMAVIVARGADFL